MAKLYISEYRHAAVDALRQPIGAPLEPSDAEQVIEIGPESKVSEPFGTNTTFVMLECDAPCSISFGVKPVATQEKRRMGTGYRPFGVRPGMRVAVIEND